MIPDWARLAVGTLTVVRVPPPGEVNSRVGGRAMTAAPLVGLLLSIPLAALVALGQWVGISALLTATLAIGLLALLTRGLHLDGLADTADGLGSGREGSDALAIMSRSDIGPFGVVTLVLVLLAQICALGQLLADSAAGYRWIAVAVVALMSSRAALPLACRHGVRSAKPTGLGALVASTVGRTTVVLVVGATVMVCGAAGWLAAQAQGATVAVIGAVVGVIAAELTTRRCVRRFGGVTGDTLGACVEVAFTACLVVMAVVTAVLMP